MSVDKYPSIFSHQMEAIVYIYPKTVHVAKKDLKDNKHDSLHLGENMLDICPWT